MEQQQFRISFSVGTKLLISVAVLLFILIVFLSSSTVLLLTNDKQAYIFETQSLEATLSGNELSTKLQHSLDTLRIALGNADFSKASAPDEKGSLQTMMRNQSDLAFLSL